MTIPSYEKELFNLIKAKGKKKALFNAYIANSVGKLVALNLYKELMKDEHKKNNDRTRSLLG